MQRITKLKPVSINTPSKKLKEGVVYNIQKSGRLLLEMINDILDHSKIEADQLFLEHTTFHLDTLLHDAVGLLSFATENKNIENRKYNLKRLRS